jgi:hypothetical protein
LTVTFSKWTLWWYCLYLKYSYVRGRRDKIKWDLLSEGIEDSIDAVAKANLNLEILSNTVLSVWEKNGTSIGVKDEYVLTYIVCDDTEECRNSHQLGTTTDLKLFKS